MSATPATQAADVRRAARRFLAARRLERAWRAAVKLHALHDLCPDARLALGARFTAGAHRFAAQLYKQLSAHGEPVRVGRRVLRVDTETTGIVADPAPRRRRRPGPDPGGVR